MGHKANRTFFFWYIINRNSVFFGRFHTHILTIIKAIGTFLSVKFLENYREAHFFCAKKYSRKVVSYDEINKSIEGIDFLINLYKYEDFDYKININLLKATADDYIKGRDSMNKFQYSYQSFNQDIIFGINYYNYLLDVFIKEEPIDVRPFHVLYDHKILMKIRLEYLKKIENFDDSDIDNIIKLNNSLIKMSYILRSLVIKYNITHNYDIKQRISEKCCSIKESDCKLFVKLLKYLSE